MKVRLFGALRVAAAAVLLVAGPIGPAHAATTQSCRAGLFAPRDTACTTGSHLRTTSTISHDVSADIDYVGTIESILSGNWAGSPRIFRCTYSQALKRVCSTSGSFPPISTTLSFTHVCRSLAPATGTDPVMEVEGGVGPWNCSVTF